MIITTTTEPAVEPVTLTEVKLHCRIAIDAASAAVYTTEDYWLERNISAARMQAEQETSRKFITQTLTMYFDCWPDENFIKIPYPPLQSATVTYRLESDDDYDNTLSTVDVDIVSEPGRVILQPEESWPTGTLYPDKPIKVVLVCGYGLAAAVPSGIKSAVLLKIEDLYNNRGEVVVGAAVNRITDAVDSLLRNFRVHAEFDR